MYRFRRLYKQKVVFFTAKTVFSCVISNSRSDLIKRNRKEGAVVAHQEEIFPP